MIDKNIYWPVTKIRYFFLYNIRKIVLLMIMVLGIISNVSADISVETKIFDFNSQPPIVGGEIVGYSDEGNLKSGVIVSTNMNDLEYKNEKTKMDPYFMWKDEDLVSMDSYIVDCTSIGKEQFWTTLRLLKPNKDYYVRAYVIIANGACIYGNMVKIHSLNFSRWTSGHSDYANVYHAFEYSLFDLITDEIINPQDGFYYSSNENPKTVKHQVGTGYNTCYKFATEWNYKLWYYHSRHCVSEKIINPPLMTINDNALYIEKNPMDADKEISIYYSINGNFFRPESFINLYQSPVHIKSTCTVYCYAKSSDGYISYTNMYVVNNNQESFNPGNIAEQIDLGLSVKWASWNIGASKVGDYGGLYGAGDPTGLKTSTNASDYYFKNGESICGTEYDLAHVKWGKPWRMPTWNELEELKTKCIWSDGEVDGVKGCWVKGPNGNSLFLPWAGNRYGSSSFSDKGVRGYYYSGDMGVTLHSYGYKDLDIQSGGVFQTDGSTNYWGQSIRPVYSEKTNIEWHYSNIPGMLDLSNCVIEKGNSQYELYNNAGWNGTDIDWMQSGQRAIVAFTNTKANTRYDIVHYASTQNSGVSVDFLITDSEGNVFYKKEVSYQNNQDWASYIQYTSLPTTDPMPEGNFYLTLIYYSPNSSTTVNISRIDFEEHKEEAIIITANSFTREYGENNPSFEYTVSDSSVRGIPSITCSATSASPVGTYKIKIEKGSVTNNNVTYVDGTLTITKAPLTVTANSYSRTEGEDNPLFDVTYSGFKNNETESVLTRKPNITTSATSSSSLGSYDINVSGAEAENYFFNYVKGTLTVTENNNNTPTDYASQYLTFVARENGIFKLNGNSVSYSLDNGLTWNTLADNTDSPMVQSGKKIVWKGTLTPTIGGGIGEFSSTGQFDVEGNIMSLLFGDNFRGQTSLSGKNEVFIHLFGGCNIISAENLVLPATTLTVSCYEQMFYGCSSLITAPSLPATTLTISCYEYMFRDCTSLTRAPELPATTLATSCYMGMFAGCSSLNYVKCLATNISATSYTSYWLQGVSSSGTFVKASIATWERGDNGIPNNWIIQNDNESSPEIGQVFEVDGIYYKVGDNNTVSVTSGEVNYSGDVVVPEKVTYNGKSYSVVSIGIAFYGCNGLTSVTIPNSVTRIGDDAFGGCESLYSITIPNSVTRICESAFQGCSNLTSVTIPNSVISIEYFAFGYCSGLTIIVTEIENPFEISENVFYCSDKDIYATATLVVPPGKKSAYQNTSGWNKFANIVEAGDGGVIGQIIKVDNVNYKIGEKYTMSVTKSVKSYSDVYMGDVVIHAHIAYNGVTYNVTSIEGDAFCNRVSSYGITSVTIPSSIKSIGGDAFLDQFGLEAVYITDLDGWCNISFGGEGSNPLKYAHHLYLNGTEIKDLVIPNGITSIKYRTFIGCSGLTSITIPSSVTYIGGHAFYYCSGLTSITIPNSVTSIGESAFSYCSGLTTIVSEIENPFEISENVFDSDIYASATLTVPTGTKSLYQSTAGWKRFQNIVEVGGVGYQFESGGIYYIIGENNTVSVTANGGSEDNYKYYYGNVVIPNHVTYNGTTYSVTKIGNCAFWYCSNLTSITIPSSVTYIGEDAFLNCNNLTAVHITDLEAWLKVNIHRGTISYGGVGIDWSGNPLYYAHHLYLNGEEVKSIEIPNTWTSIPYLYFEGWSGLTSITIPNSVTSIGWGAFSGCNGLTTIVSEIKNPFEIVEYVFNSDIYASAILTVPAGTKSLYLATAGWNQFQNIVEDNSDEANFSINGITYQGSKSAKTVMVKSVDKSLASLEIPASVSFDGIDYQVTGIENNAFDGSKMGALIWNVESALPNNAFSNASIGSNFLLYVKSTSYAPSSVKNVVVNGTASSVVLADDGSRFYCPQAFTANSISYTHNYSMETGGNGKGWETIALPFDVQRIVHSTRGEIVPFAAYSSNSNLKPFWLANMSASGFKRASSIQAYEPYIIAMPNNSKYKNDYNLAGDVTFSSENVQIPKIPTFNGLFLPAFSTVAKSSTVFALNVNNRYVPYSGSDVAGSRFISNLRDVRPFEAYINTNSTRGVFEITFDDGTTDMDDILLSADGSQEITIHTLSGQQMARTTQRDFGQIWNRLPKGVYIVNGKKRIR